MTGEPMNPRAPSQESDQVSGGTAVVLWVASVLIVVVCAVIALFLIRAGVAGPESPRTAAGQAERPPRVRPLYTTGSHASGPDAAQRSHLDEYHWIDRQRGIVAVPIEDAMRLLAGTPDTLADTLAGGRP